MRKPEVEVRFPAENADPTLPKWRKENNSARIIKKNNDEKANDSFRIRPIYKGGGC